MDRISIKLPEPTRLALEKVAQKDDVSVGQIIRDAIARDLKRRHKAKTPVRVDERLVAPLRALLADDFAFAETWEDLQIRLGGKGYALREAGGGLCLYSAKQNQRVCKGSELGYSYATLMRKFNSPFPNHSHRYLYRKICG